MTPESTSSGTAPSAAPPRNIVLRGLAWVFRKVGKLCYGVDLIQLATANKRRHEANSRQIEGMERRMAGLQRQLEVVVGALEAAASNPHALWLFANRAERMDPTAPFFDSVRSAFHLARYSFASAYTQGKRAVDLACGPGYGSELLKTEGGATAILGIDIDPHAASYAAHAHGKSGARFACASGTAIPVADSSLEVVVSFETIEHLPDEEALMREFHRILKPGGRLICSTPNQWPLDKAPFHVREYDRASFEAVLSRHFQVDELYNQNSGSDWEFNRGQPAGIVKTTPENEANAECYLAVCTRK